MARKKGRKAAPAASTRQRPTAARGARSNAPTAENQDGGGSTPTPPRRSSRIRQMVQARQQGTSKESGGSRTLHSPEQRLPPRETKSRKIRTAKGPQRGEPSPTSPSPPPRTRSPSADVRPTKAQQGDSPLRPSASRSSRVEKASEAEQQEPTQVTVATRNSLPTDYQEVGPAPPRTGSASSPNTAPSPPDPTLAGLLFAYPAAQSLLSNLNEWDRRSLISTLPRCRAALNAPNMRVWSYCQDRPEHPNLMMADNTNPNRFLQSFNHLQYGRCDTLDDAPIRHQMCRGHELGYAADILSHSRHGPIFWVCDACARRAWEQHTILFKPPCVDLCLRCSQAHRSTIGDRAANQCTCLWDQSADKAHLCTECRKVKTRRDQNTLMDCVRRRTQLQPMHAGMNGPHHIRDYVREDSDRGASSCVCGMFVARKVASHLGRAMRISHTTFDQFVRLCVWCHRPRFLAKNPYL